MNHWSKITKINDDANYNGALAVTAPDQVLFRHTQGIADYATGMPFTFSTTSGIGSVTKQFLATVVLMLAEKGEVALSDRLSQYLPEYRFADQITLRQLLNMAAGVPDYVDAVVKETLAGRVLSTDPDDDPQINRAVGENISLVHALALINPLPLTYTPGTESHYSNSNYLLLGTVVERVTGQGLAQIFQQRIFSVLGMTRTKLGTQFAQADSYLKIDDRLVTLGRGHHIAGDGGLVTTITDLTRWAQAVLQQRFLQPTTWQAAMTLYKDFYGFAWLKKGSWYWHGGRVLGYQADIYVSPERGLATTWLYNVTPVNDARLAAWYPQRDAWHEQL
ncbi:MAG: beta-lactamase family protein [Schleiferilactobacillus harbinensis]|jgi:CubicO group peptidase (beta-lactamase class C family)|nr:beta-lactamase family protein [Schleiferilactobacillus harbinensis]MCI1913125.1 beta-lactamase family protein [Schleiferilactobacillus harbinensis]